MSFCSATAFRTFRSRFSIRTPVCTRSISTVPLVPFMYLCTKVPQSANEGAVFLSPASQAVHDGRSLSKNCWKQQKRPAKGERIRPSNSFSELYFNLLLTFLFSPCIFHKACVTGLSPFRNSTFDVISTRGPTIRTKLDWLSDSTFDVNLANRRSYRNC